MESNAEKALELTFRGEDTFLESGTVEKLNMETFVYGIDRGNFVGPSAIRQLPSILVDLNSFRHEKSNPLHKGALNLKISTSVLKFLLIINYVLYEASENLKRAS